MTKILNFPDKKSERELAKAHDDVLIEEHSIKLKMLYSQLQHVVKEINYHKEVLKMLESGKSS
jgi:hypothetical protein